MCCGVGGAGWSALLHRHLAEYAVSNMLLGDLHHIHFQKNGGDLVNPITDECIYTNESSHTWAKGSMSYRCSFPPDSRPSTYMEIDVSWEANSVDHVLVKKSTNRIWFDGSVCYSYESECDLTGHAAYAFLESSQGRRSTFISINSLLSPFPIHSNAY